MDKPWMDNQEPICDNFLQPHYIVTVMRYVILRELMGGF